MDTTHYHCDFAGQRHYVIATEGSCTPNPGTGGWGAVIQLKMGSDILKQRVLAGQGEVMISTNNKMELTALIMALHALAEPLPVIILTDSQYVVQGMTEGLAKWKPAGWRNSRGPVKNRDLWEQLDQASTGRTIQWVWVKAHAGHALNEMADQLAENAAAGKYQNDHSAVKKLHPDWFR